MDGERLSLEDAAKALGISTVTARRWVKSGKLRAYKPGQKYQIPVEAAEDLLRPSAPTEKENRLRAFVAERGGKYASYNRDEFNELVDESPESELTGVRDDLTREREVLEGVHRADESDRIARSAFARAVEYHLITQLALTVRANKREEAQAGLLNAS